MAERFLGSTGERLLEAFGGGLLQTGTRLFKHVHYILCDVNTLEHCTKINI